MLRIASFNLENLFTRPSAMSSDNDAEGSQAIEDHATANAIAKKEVYSDEDKATFVELSLRYGWHLLNAPVNALVKLQKIRGQLLSTAGGPLHVAADGSADWTGWFELRRQDVSWEATKNTGRVIAAINPDILVVVEAEDRPTLNRFNEQVLKTLFNLDFPHVMLIDGNDERGIDVGILSKFPLVEMRSHVDDLNAAGNRVFSRDCPEYDVLLPNNKRLVLLPNHFKSKRNGNDQVSRNRRTAQGKRAREIAVSALARSPFVLIAGDLNDTPDSATLAQLITAGFQDIQSHPSYPTDRPGTFGTGLIGNKIDYLIMSPELRAKLKRTDVERRGSYHPRSWVSFDTVTNTANEASDHHLVWADFDL